jgi:hypothetical protein
LCEDWRERLGGIAPPCPEVGDWAEQELGRADLGDRRLRLLEVARDCYARPWAQLPQAFGSRARTKAAYRLFDHPRTQMRQVLNSHNQATAARVADHPVVLAVPHSTSLNYSAHPLTEGLGPLNTRADNSIGLWLHDTLAFTPAGIPLWLGGCRAVGTRPAGPGSAYHSPQSPHRMDAARRCGVHPGAGP